MSEATNVGGTCEHVWALVLAAGDGNRLRSLTTTREGIAVPKQYCSLHGGASLLDNALQRAEAVASKDRVCTVVAAQHRRWWEPHLNAYSTERIVVQPKNCGTAIGIMLPLLHILQQDPAAQVLMLPSDHYVRDERILSRSLLQAAQRLQSHPDQSIVAGHRTGRGRQRTGLCAAREIFGRWRFRGCTVH